MLACRCSGGIGIDDVGSFCGTNTDRRESSTDMMRVMYVFVVVTMTATVIRDRRKTPDANRGPNGPPTTN